jgi:hypothetical protein
LIFNSNQNVFKIVQTDTATLPSNSLTTAAGAYGSNSSQVTVTHNLGYIPVILAYFYNGTNTSPFPAQGFAQNGVGFILDWCQSTATSTDFTLYSYIMGFN